MNLLQMQKGHKAFGLKILFDEASFSINEGEHIGVIGPNGAGKTTLFRILVGQDHLDSGELTKSQSLRIGYLEQESEWPLDQTSEDYLREHTRKPLWELKKLGLELGLTEAHFASPLRALSGGYRMRMKLLELIGLEPNLMLLDEPTNFLDLESVLALENFLQSYEGAFLLISHDREFLKRTTESTLEVEAQEITMFPGHIDDYFEQKQKLQEVLAAQIANQEAKRKHIQDFVDRFRAKATKARQAQSRMKLLEKMEKIETKDLPVRARIHIPPPIHTGKETLSLEQASLGYADRCILKNVNLRLERGKHLGVVGPNGAGKSTLLKSLAGQLPLLKGERRLGYQVSLAHFSQHSADQLDLDEDILDALERAAQSDLVAQDILNVAGSLLFSGEDLKKKIRVLSGGEKSRVALGQVLLKRSPLLLLDEPTNHLDVETVEALTEALRDYAGSLIVVSHDRSFIGRVANQILEIRGGGLELYPGTYDEYVWSLQQRGAAGFAEPKPTSVSKKTTAENAPAPAVRENLHLESKRLRGELKEVQRKVLKCEELLFAKSKQREELTAGLLQAQGVKAQELAKALSEISREVEGMEEDLLRHLENQDEIEKSLARMKGD